MFRYFEPNKIFSITYKAPKYVLLLFIIVISIGLTEALVLSPEDYKQGHAVRIMYVHVPSAWTTLGIFSLFSLGIRLNKEKVLLQALRGPADPLLDPGVWILGLGY